MTKGEAIRIVSSYVAGPMRDPDYAEQQAIKRLLQEAKRNATK
jgi:hypothetical protein